MFSGGVSFASPGVMRAPPPHRSQTRRAAAEDRALTRTRFGEIRMRSLIVSRVQSLDPSGSWPGFPDLGELLTRKPEAVIGCSKL